MKKFLLAAMLALATPFASQAQTVTIPERVELHATKLTKTISLSYDGDEIVWDCPEDLDCDRLYSHDPKVVSLKLTAYEGGREYIFKAWTAKVVDGKAKLSPVARCTIVAPGKPKPPDPVDPTPPQPKDVIPAKALSAVIVEESSERPNLPPGQVAAMYANSVKEYTRQRYPGGLMIIDKDAKLDNAPDFVKTVMARPRQSLPWIVISDGQGRQFEGPAPESVTKMLELLKKYGG